MSFFDEEHNPYEADDMIEASQLALRRDMRAMVEKNKDKGRKHIGDRVLIWDCSRLTDYVTNEVNRDELDHNILSRFPSIVIDSSCKYNADVIIGDRTYSMNLDLVIWNKTIGKRFRTNSEFVKRTENKE